MRNSKDNRKQETDSKHRDVLKKSLRLALELSREQSGLTLEEIAVEMKAVFSMEELEAICKTWTLFV